jgi:glycogen(starch) synthase
MRVLFWSEFFWPYIGGAEVFAANLVPALRSRGHEFIIVTSQGYRSLPDQDEYQGIPIFRFPFREVLEGSRLHLAIQTRQRIAKLKKTFQPDLIHIVGVNPSVVFHLQTENGHPVPTLVRINQEIMPKESVAPDTLLGRVLRAADWITSVSTAILEDVRQKVPETLSRTSTIYSAFDTRSWPISKPSLTGPITLLCLGRLVPAKGFDLALRALPLILEHHRNVRLKIAGGGPLRAKLEQQVTDLGLDRIVEFVGEIDPAEVPALINTASLVVMPSRREGLPLVGIQAALLGRPVVATRVAGLPEIVSHRQTGLLVEKDDSVALASAITFLLNHPDTFMKMSQAALRRAHEMFNWECCVDAYDALYYKLGRSDVSVLDSRL